MMFVVGRSVPPDLPARGLRTSIHYGFVLPLKKIQVLVFIAWGSPFERLGWKDSLRLRSSRSESNTRHRLVFQQILSSWLAPPFSLGRDCRTGR